MTTAKNGFAKQIARAIVAARQDQPVATTHQLSQIVAQAVRTREPGKNPATRTFQAIRIYLNQELEEIAQVLPAMRGLPETGRAHRDHQFSFAGRSHGEAIFTRHGTGRQDAA